MAKFDNWAIATPPTKFGVVSQVNMMATRTNVQIKNPTVNAIHNNRRDRISFKEPIIRHKLISEYLLHKYKKIISIFVLTKFDLIFFIPYENKLTMAKNSREKRIPFSTPDGCLPERFPQLVSAHLSQIRTLLCLTYNNTPLTDHINILIK